MIRFFAFFALLWGLLAGSALAGACADLTAAMAKTPGGAAFLVSYPTVKDGPLHDTAFLYDNAAAAIALSACNRPAEARRIGDAIVYALDRDRFWHDGRLRNAYAAGSVGPGPVKLPGWWDPKENHWVEDRYQAGSDTGNLAWAMLALLTLDETAPDRRYRAGAAKIGAFLATRRDGRGAGGFTGGTFGFEPHPQGYSWKSTEHNIDVAAAFRRLAKVGGGAQALADAGRAAGFVRAMWRADGGCFAAGVGDDGKSLNRLIALDTQVWAALALDERPIDGVLEKRLADAGGYAYDETKGGFWTEGTASVALWMQLHGRRGASARLLRRLSGLRRADGYAAAEGLGAGTGLGLATDPMTARRYFAMPHLAATAWMALAERRFNPFTGTTR